MNKKKWLIKDQEYFFDNIPKVSNTLPVGIYELSFDIKVGFYLVKVTDNFVMPEKLYGVESELIGRMVKTFKSVDKNFGVLLQGLKGTGKTVTAKIVCNELKIPVILINTAFKNIGTFINSIEQDVILFFDEFEKVYEFNTYIDDEGDEEEAQGKKPSVSGLLTLMDGVFTSKYKRLFLLTTNKKYLPDPMLSRPSRIRYIKEFSDLGYEHIMEILNDSVNNKELIPGLVKILSELEIITIDIVKAVAEEANIYNTADPEFFTIFNIKSKNTYYDIFLDDSPTPEEERSEIKPVILKKNRGITIGGAYYVVQKAYISGDDKMFDVIKQNRKGEFSEKVHKLTFKLHKSVHQNLEMAL